MENIKNFLFLIAVYLMVIGNVILLFLHFTSCQPKDNLKNLNCPCKVISAELTYHGHIVTYIDKDGKLSEPTISEALYNQYHKNLKK